ncbi:MAG: hypothetical protein AAGG11_12575 [Pseudomonadota bacterium]
MDPLSPMGTILVAALVTAFLFPSFRARLLLRRSNIVAERRRNRSLAGAVLSLSVFALAGCASAPTQPCDSLSCMKQAAVQPIYEDCMRDLLFEDKQSQRERRRIRDTYAYPLTNASTYFGLGASPANSPSNWCRRYADTFAQVTVANART